MDADEQQQEGERGNSKQRGKVVERHHSRGNEKGEIRDERKRCVEDPIFQLRLIVLRTPGPPDDDQGIANAEGTADPGDDCRVQDVGPWHAENRRDQQHGAEVNDGRRAESIDFAGVGSRALFGDERHDHELQARQRARRRSHDDVKVLPRRQHIVSSHCHKYWPLLPVLRQCGRE